MGSHQVVNYAVYELSLVHADMIPWFYSPFTIIFEVASASCRHDGTLPSKW